MTTEITLLASSRHARTNQLLAHAADDRTAAASRAEAIERAVVLNMPVAREVASRFRNRGVPTEDLEQVAYTALLRAARRYDPAQARDFLSYAVPSIRGELKRYFRDHAWVVRPPRKVQEIQLGVLGTARRLEHELGRRPTVAELAAELGEDEGVVSEALLARGCYRPTSLDAPVADAEALSLAETLPDEAQDREWALAEARVVVPPVVRGLSPRDRRLIQLRFGEGRTQGEIARELGVTQTQVSRLLTRILTDLRCQLEGRGSGPQRAG